MMIIDINIDMIFNIGNNDRNSDRGQSLEGVKSPELRG